MFRVALCLVARLSFPQQAWMGATLSKVSVQVDGVRNPKIQSIFFDDMPIHKAAFAVGGSHVRSRCWHLGHVLTICVIFGRDKDLQSQCVANRCER